MNGIVPESVCIVFDGSTKTKTNPISLNNCLKTRPNLIPELFDVRVRFRWNLVALKADIEKETNCDFCGLKTPLMLEVRCWSSNSLA